MDPKLFASGGNVAYITDPTLELDLTANPDQAMRKDYGPSVTVRGKVMMANGRITTTKLRPRRARIGMGARGRTF